MCMLTVMRPLAAFLTTDQRRIDSYNISWYSDRQYPDILRQRYAKAGVRELERVQLSIWRKFDRRITPLSVELPEE